MVLPWIVHTLSSFPSDEKIRLVDNIGRNSPSFMSIFMLNDIFGAVEISIWSGKSFRETSIARAGPETL